MKKSIVLSVAVLLVLSSVAFGMLQWEWSDDQVLDGIYNMDNEHQILFEVWWRGIDKQVTAINNLTIAVSVGAVLVSFALLVNRKR